MTDQGSVIAVHPFPQYVEEEVYRDVAEDLSEDFPVYGVEASNYSSEDMIGDFYDQSLEEVENGRNGAISSGDIEGLEPPFYVIGGLVHDCVPGSLESLMRSGHEPYLVEDGVFEKFGDEEFMTYAEMIGSDEDFSNEVRNLYMLGVEPVELDNLV